MGIMAPATSYVSSNVKGQIYAAIPNEDLKNKDGSKKSKLDRIVDFTKLANGAFRVLQFLERVAKLAFHILQKMGSALASFFEKVAGKLSVAWAMLTIPRLPEVTQTAKKAVSNWSKPSQGPVPTSAFRDKTQKIHDIADATASWGYAGSLVLSNPAIKNAADIPDLVANVTELKMATEDWSLAREGLKFVNANDSKNRLIQQRFVDKTQHALIKIVKAVASVLSGVIGLIALTYGTTLFSPVTLVGIGLVSTVAAIVAHFFEKTRSLELIDFHKFKHPELVVNGHPIA